MELSTIEDVFIQKLNLFDGLIDCVRLVIQAELANADEVVSDEIHKTISVFKIVAEYVEADGAARSLKGIEPSYHNRQHITEVLTATQLLLDSLDRQHLEHGFTLKQRLLILIAATGHDYLHNGGMGDSITDAEKMSADAIKALLISQGISSGDAEYVHGLIMATARTNVVDNHLFYKANPDSLNTKLLAKLLLSEADIFASLMPNYGIQCGKLLADENAKAGNEIASFIASNEGRQYFLTHSFISSPHAKSLGLDQLVLKQIN